MRGIMENVGKTIIKYWLVVIMFLMLKNTKVMYFDLEDFVVEVIREDLLPFAIRSNITSASKPKDILHNIQAVKSYLSSRMLSLSRDNAKQIYAAYQIPQTDSIDDRVNVCIKCKGVSIQDSYWIQDDKEDEEWDKINIRQNKLSDILDLSLSGFSPTITTNKICPELTTKGLFRKGWIHIDDSLYLLKSDRTSGYINTKMEVLASRILDCFENKIETIMYYSDIKGMIGGDAYVSICKNFVGEKYSFVEAWEVMDYCKRRDIDFRKKCLEQWGNLFACIPVLDYIIINTDRHTQNYGFFMNNETGVIEELAPLFDYNCALVADYFKRDARDTLSQMFNTSETLKQLAFAYINNTRIEFREDKFMKLVEEYQQYRHIFEQVYIRIQELGII